MVISREKNTPSDLDRNVGFILSDLARLLRLSFDRRIKKLGLTRSQWFLLAHLHREDGLTQANLAELVEQERASVGRTIDRLEENKWVTRQNDANDRRVRRIFLTDKFSHHVESLSEVSDELLSEAFSHLKKSEFEELVTNLNQARTNLLMIT